MKIQYFRSIPKVCISYFKDKIVRKKHASILMYHSISDAPEFFSVSKASFEEQMAYLYEQRYKVLPLLELADILKKGENMPNKVVVITFDDGYEDNLKNAVPILEKYGFMATVFLTTGWIGDKNHLTKHGNKLSMLDWDQIKEIHTTGLIDFQPHTVSHPRLSKIDPNQAKKEMIDSKKEIEDRLDKKCWAFAYPYGDFNKEIESAAEDLFDLTLSVEKGFIGKADSPYSLRRNAVDYLTDKFLFRLKV